MFPVNIMGIFSSGGAIPLSSLPIVHRIFSFILPTRYVVEGMRALLYYQGRLQAGLGAALWAVSVYFIVTLVSLIAFINFSKKYKDKPVDESAEKVEIEVENEIHHQPANQVKNHKQTTVKKDEMFRQALVKFPEKKNLKKT
jgi:hypothetical protein